MQKVGVSAIALSVMLSACSGMGSQPVLTRAGVVDGDVRQGLLTSGPIYNFVQAERRARPYPAGLDTEEESEDAEARRDDPAANREMLEAGFTAIYASCDEFFRSSGRDQTRLLVIRDIIVALSSLAGGALAVIDGNNETGGDGNENVLAGIALGTTALLSGVDIYTQRFLFGAENIDAVRELTMRALDTHRTGVLGQNPTQYDRILVHLMDNQAKCSPRAISRLAREAIAAGNLEADSGQGSLRTQQNLTQDQRALAELARILDMSESLTEAEAGALWWLLIAAEVDQALAPTPEEVAGAIKSALSRIPQPRQPIGADGTRVQAWSPEASVREVLRNLSEPTRRAFRLAVAAARQQAANPDAGAQGILVSPGRPSPARPSFRMGTPTATDRRVTVRVAAPD